VSAARRLAVAATVAGFAALGLAFAGLQAGEGWLGILLSIGLITAGGSAASILAYRDRTPGIENDGVFFRALTSREAIAWALGILFTGFYVVLYFRDDLVARGWPDVLAGGVRLVDPLSRLLAGVPADRWFLYGTLYTLAVLVMGVRMLAKYRHSRYQQVRTLSVMFFQLGFAYLIPAFLKALEQPEFYFSYFWPLKYDYLFPGSVGALASHPGGLGVFMVFWAAVLTFVATPVLTYFLGKRWYCSWVCGCGGLAETLGDPFRQLSDKSLRAWRIERWTIHSVLALVTLCTALLWLNSWKGGALLGSWSQGFARGYGLYVGALFSGVVGVGFYPLMGSRVWCRFGCPLAAILGFFQRFFSRFRITTNGGQCISCGNCSTYCEMGIDVRWYAQRGENVVRSSCVGCGVCAAVCPRGVLALENGPTHADRFEGSDRPVQAFLEAVGARPRGPA